MEKLIHLIILELEYLQRNSPNASSDKLVFKAVKRHGRLEDWERLQSIIEEEIDGV